jgi:hypothetical protein
MLDFTNDPKWCKYVRQESNLHALPQAPESESGTSPNSVTDARHHEVRSAGLEPARPYGHPGLSRARLPDFRHERGCHHCVVLKVQTRQGYSPASPPCTRTGRVRCCKHVATRNVECRGDISLEFVAAQSNWMRRNTGMSGDVPGRDNSNAEVFMRVFFGPLLPAGAHAH